MCRKFHIVIVVLGGRPVCGCTDARAHVLGLMYGGARSVTDGL